MKRIRNITWNKGRDEEVTKWIKQRNIEISDYQGKERDVEKKL